MKKVYLRFHPFVKCLMECNFQMVKIIHHVFDECVGHGHKSYFIVIYYCQGFNNILNVKVQYIYRSFAQHWPHNKLRITIESFTSTVSRKFRKLLKMLLFVFFVTSRRNVISLDTSWSRQYILKQVRLKLLGSKRFYIKDIRGP